MNIGFSEASVRLGGDSGLVGRSYERFPGVIIPAIMAGLAIAGAAKGLTAKGPDLSTAGAFPGSDQLGEDFQKFLRERLTTPVNESSQFAVGSAAIRDATGAIAKTARQRLGDAGTAGGFLDSGNLQLSGNVEIDRAEMQSFTAAIRQLLLGLESQKTEGVLGFLQGAEGAQANLNQNLASLFSTEQGAASSATGNAFSFLTAK